MIDCCNESQTIEMDLLESEMHVDQVNTIRKIQFSRSYLLLKLCSLQKGVSGIEFKLKNQRNAIFICRTESQIDRKDLLEKVTDVEQVNLVNENSV